MATQVIFLPGWYRFAWVELVVLLAGYASYRVSLADAWHQKWLNDRRLAEGLRGAMFVSLVSAAGAAPPKHGAVPDTSSDGLRALPFYSAANTWFVATLKRVVAKERRQFADHLAFDVEEGRLAVARFLRDAWILDQAEHHKESSERHGGFAKRNRRQRLIMIGVLALVALLHAIGFGHGSHEAGSLLMRFDLMISLATVSLPAWAAAFHVISSLDDHERLAERSKEMAGLLRGLAREFTEATTLDELQAAVGKAERIMDLETAEWAESLVDRKPEFTG